MKKVLSLAVMAVLVFSLSPYAVAFAVPVGGNLSIAGGTGADVGSSNSIGGVGVRGKTGIADAIDSVSLAVKRGVSDTVKTRAPAIDGAEKAWGPEGAKGRQPDTQDPGSTADTGTPEGEDASAGYSGSSGDGESDDGDAAGGDAAGGTGKDDDGKPDGEDGSDAAKTEDGEGEEGRSSFSLRADTTVSGLYVIQSGFGTVVDITHASKDSGANAQLHGSNSTPAQRFAFTLGSDGCYTIKNTNSGKVLDVQSGRKASGANVWQYAPNNSDAQKWSLEKTEDADGSYRIVSKLDKNLCLDVSGGNASNGANLQIYAKNDTKAQKFKLMKIEQTVDPGYYTVKSSVGSSKVLDVANGSVSSGANIQLFTANSTAAQIFKLEYDSSQGYYTITNIASGSCLDVAGGGTWSGANVQQFTSNGTYAQKWAVETNGDGFYRIRSACSGLSLDVAGGSSANGANVQIWSGNATAAQKWAFAKATLPAVEEGLYVIKSALDTGKVVEVAGSSMNDTANVHIHASNGSWAQKFWIKSAGNGYYTITSYKSGKALDVAYGGKGNGTNVFQYAANGTDAQLWKPIYSNGGYVFESKCNGLVLDVAGGSTANGANIQCWQRNGTNAQRFILTKTDESVALQEGAYTVSSASEASKCLDVTGGSAANGARIQLYPSNGTFAQKYKALSAGSGQFYLVCVGSSKYLDVDNETRSFVQQYARNTSTNQKWRIISVGKDEVTYHIQSVLTGAYLTNTNGKLTLAAKTGAANQEFIFSNTAAFKVYLDAGHGVDSNGRGGGYDPGAIGSGLVEAELNKELVNKIAAECQKKGVQVYVNTYGGPYRDRHQEAVNMGCSTYISIHFNASGGTGSESYIHSYNRPAGSATLQGIVHRYLIAGTTLRDRGMREAEFAVIGGRLPSVLLEVGFIDNVGDMNTYLSRKDTVALFLAAGIKEASTNNACGWY